AMTLPGFGAESSLYKSSIDYRSTGASVQPDPDTPLYMSIEQYGRVFCPAPLVRCGRSCCEGVIRLIPTLVVPPAGHAGDFVLVLVILVVKTLLAESLRSANRETGVVPDPSGVRVSPPVTRPWRAKHVARTRAPSAISKNIVVMERASHWELRAS